MAKIALSPSKIGQRTKTNAQSETGKDQHLTPNVQSKNHLRKRILPSLLVMGLLITTPAAAYGSDIKYDQLLRGQISELKEKRKEVRQQQDDIQKRLDWDSRARGYAYLLSTNNLDPLRAQMDPVDIYGRMSSADKENFKVEVCKSLAQQQAAPDSPEYPAIYQGIYDTIDLEQFVKDHPNSILTDEVVRAYWSAVVNKIGILSEIERQDYVQMKNSMVVQVDSQIRLLQSQGLLLNNQAKLQNALTYVQSREAQRDYTGTTLESSLAEQRLASSLADAIDKDALTEQVDYLRQKGELQKQLWQLTAGYSAKLGVPTQLTQPAGEVSDEEAIAQAKSNRYEILNVKEEKAVATARSVQTEIDLADAHLLKVQKDLEMEVYQSSLDLAKVRAQQTHVQSVIKSLDAQIQWMENRPADQSALAINTLKQQRDQYRLQQDALADQEQLLIFWRQLQRGIGPLYRGMNDEQ